MRGLGDYSRDGAGHFETGKPTQTTVGAAAVEVSKGDGRACAVWITCLFPATSTIVAQSSIFTNADGADKVLAVLTLGYPAQLLRADEIGDIIRQPLRASATAAGFTITVWPVYWHPKED